MSYIGNNKIDSIYLGDTKISKAYLGENLVYSASPGIDYSKKYLTLTALTTSTFKVKGTHNTPNIRNIKYSTDEGNTWTTVSVNKTLKTIATVLAGNSILLKGTYSGGYTSRTITISSTGDYKVSGNIMSLIYEDNFLNNTSLSQKPEALSRLFNASSTIIDAANLILPALTLSDKCYSGMFYNASNLLTAPKMLPALNLTPLCYSNMFNGCTVLTTTPKLPATVLANSCYEQMFSYCTALTTTPKLPATVMAEKCYSYMFEQCTALVHSPELPATNLAECCYLFMFTSCTSLNISPLLPATTLANSCYTGMFLGTNILPDCSNIDFTSQTVVASGGLNGLFYGTIITNEHLRNILPINLNNRYYLPVLTLSTKCYLNMFSNCKYLVTAPELPATILANSCYESMFSNCIALTDAPHLPATELAEGCYLYMFSGCVNLLNAPELPATTLYYLCYYGMFHSCGNMRTAPELPAIDLVDLCYRDMFAYCNLLNYIKAMFTTTPSNTYTYGWVSCVAARGTFIKNSEATWDVTGTNGIPSGWTVLTASA